MDLYLISTNKLSYQWGCTSRPELLWGKCLCAYWEHLTSCMVQCIMITGIFLSLSF